LNRLSEAPPRLLPASIQPEGLEKAFGLLYNSLNSREKALFRALGAFAPSEPFSLEALLMVAGKVGAGRDLRDLGRLWLFADELSGEVRAHPQIAEIAQRLLSSQADEQVVFARHLTYYERWAAKHPSESSWLGQARHAHAYVLRAWPERAVAFTLNIGQALLLQNQTTELRAWLEATLRYKAALEKGQAPDLRALGDLCVKIGYHQAAQEYYELALLLYYESKSLSGQANTLKALGDLRASENHHAEAQDYYDRTLLLYAQIDFQLGRANTLKALGDLSLQKMNDLKAARNYYNRALALYEQIDFQLGQAQTFQAMGEVHVRERDYAAAKQSYQTALAFYRDIHFHSQEAATLLSLGQLYAETNALEAAYHAFEEALERYRQLDDKDGQLEALSAQGRLWLTQRHYEKAQESYQQARALAQAKHDLRGVAGLDNTLAGLYVAQGYPELALRAWLAALEGFTQLEDKAEISHVQRQLREMAQRMGKDFARVWRAVAQEQDLPDWLKLAPASPLPKRLVYAVRDFVLLQDSYAQQRAVEENADLLLTDEADEVFASMLRQYAGQTAPARQIDRYRALLQRCRQIGIVPAFEEYRTPSTSEHEGQVARLRQTLDAYDQALLRLRDIPLVYASVQLSRASTLRELADLPQQDRRSCLEQALQAYDDALSHQTSAPLDYAQTQIQRAAVLRELGELPDADLRQSLLATLAAYEDALPHQQDLPSELAKTQLLRAQTLQALAKQKDEDALARYQEALAAYEQVLSVLQDNPLEVARTQSSRALLLYELAGLPGQDFRARMTEALAAYDEALESLRDQDPLEYAKTQSQCVALLRDMAGLPGEDRRARLYQALASSNEGLRYIANAPDFYATAQINRAHLLREIAGLSGEHRLARLREALATYNDALAHVAEAPFEYAGVQNSRATLLREIAAMSGRDSAKRLRDSLEAVTEVLIIMGRLDPQDAQYKTAQRTFISTRQEIYQQLGEEIFLEWWKSASGGAPLPAWALE
jgi:tetratricopeptide (TPR) repeat protein